VRNFMDSWVEAARFGYDAQRVIGLRMLRMAAGGTDASAEARMMVSEKLAAFADAQMAIAVALVSGNTLDVAAARAYRPYRRRVRANKSRLSRLR
jgi:hypothetical protein